MLNPELIPTGCCDCQSINGFREIKPICGGCIQMNMLNRMVWIHLMPLEVSTTPMPGSENCLSRKGALQKMPPFLSFSSVLYHLPALQTAH